MPSVFIRPKVRSGRSHAVTCADESGVDTRTGKKTPGGAGTLVPVKRHRGEPGHTRDRHTNRTNRTPSKPTHPPTRARQTTPKPRQSTPKPRDARVATNHTTRTGRLTFSLAFKSASRSATCTVFTELTVSLSRLRGDYKWVGKVLDEYSHIHINHNAF